MTRHLLLQFFKDRSIYYSTFAIREQASALLSPTSAKPSTMPGSLGKTDISMQQAAMANEAACNGQRSRLR